MDAEEEARLVREAAQRVREAEQRQIEEIWRREEEERQLQRQQEKMAKAERKRLREEELRLVEEETKRARAEKRRAKAEETKRSQMSQMGVRQYGGLPGGQHQQYRQFGAPAAPVIAPIDGTADILAWDEALRQLQQMAQTGTIGRTLDVGGGGGPSASNNAWMMSQSGPVAGLQLSAVGRASGALPGSVATSVGQQQPPYFGTTAAAALGSVQGEARGAVSFGGTDFVDSDNSSGWEGGNGSEDEEALKEAASKVCPNTNIRSMVDINEYCG